MKRWPFVLSCAVLTVLLASSSQVAADWKIKSDVDLYKEPGGKGKPVGIVRKGKVFLDTQVKCRSDKWCNIPQGWIWGSFLKGGRRHWRQARESNGAVDEVDVH